MNKTEAKKVIKDAVNEAILYCGSQVSLAEKSNLTQGAIGKYIREEAMPTGVTARRLSEAVDLTIPKERFAPLVFCE
jgi:Helix-turn-helix.